MKLNFIDKAYINLKSFCLDYLHLQKCRTRAINHLRSLIELSFPELNSIFVNAHSVIALQVFRAYTHPDFLIGLTVKNMTDELYQEIGKHIKRSLIEIYCSKIWLAAKDSYPAIEADDPLILLISNYCDEIEMYNMQIERYWQEINEKKVKEAKKILS